MTDEKIGLYQMTGEVWAADMIFNISHAPDNPDGGPVLFFQGIYKGGSGGPDNSNFLVAYRSVTMQMA
jgi:hypothetical protein